MYEKLKYEIVKGFMLAEGLEVLMATKGIIPMSQYKTNREERIKNIMSLMKGGETKRESTNMLQRKNLQQ